MTRNKVVLVSFPFDDLTAEKVRPAVCLTDPIGAYRHIVPAFITSRIPTDLLDTDLVLDQHHPDFVTTGLRARSTIRLHRMMTAPATIIRRELGELPPSTHAEVAIRLRRLFRL